MHRFIFWFLCFCLPLSALTTNGNRIIDGEGHEVQLKGINWFGFNTQTTLVDGLWGGSDSVAYDFATVVYRMKLLGFNAVRLPFSFKDLYALTPRDFTQYCKVPTVQEIQSSVTPPGLDLKGKTIPPMLAPPPRKEGACNDYIPGDTTLNRFLWVVSFFAKNGFYVLLDNHLREDNTALEDTQSWVNYWVQLVTTLKKDPALKGKIMVDLLNEPDQFGIRWEATQKPGLKDYYLSAMDALYEVDPGLLFFIEGTGQPQIGANWGDGFATDPKLIAEQGLSDPNPFFQALLNKPYCAQVVISPHVYPPTVTFAQNYLSGDALRKRLDQSFGYLAEKGYCHADKCQRFPVALGELGSFFQEEKDLVFLKDFAAYLNQKDIPNWFYWSWNPNSGDTGGIVADNWKDVHWKKIDYLMTIGLHPWYQVHQQ